MLPLLPECIFLATTALVVHEIDPFPMSDRSLTEGEPASILPHCRLDRPVLTFVFYPFKKENVELLKRMPTPLGTSLQSARSWLDFSHVTNWTFKILMNFRLDSVYNLWTGHRWWWCMECQANNLWLMDPFSTKLTQKARCRTRLSFWRNARPFQSAAHFHLTHTCVCI